MKNSVKDHRKNSALDDDDGAKGQSDESPADTEERSGGREFPGVNEQRYRGHQKHENRENPEGDHPTGHLGYNRSNLDNVNPTRREP